MSNSSEWCRLAWTEEHDDDGDDCDGEENMLWIGENRRYELSKSVEKEENLFETRIIS